MLAHLENARTATKSSNVEIDKKLNEIRNKIHFLFKTGILCEDPIRSSHPFNFFQMLSGVNVAQSVLVLLSSQYSRTEMKKRIEQ